MGKLCPSRAAKTGSGPKGSRISEVVKTRGFKAEKGQATVEFALLLPILLLLLCGIMNFGWVFGNTLMTESAVREAARYTAIHYYDSSTDDDRAAAAALVTARVPTILTPTVTLTVSSGAVTVRVSTHVNMLTPIISTLFENGQCPIAAECTMRLE